MIENGITIVGAGLMGQGIASAFMAAGMDVTIYDEPARIDASLHRVRERSDADAAARGERITTGTVRAAASLGEALEGAQLAIESVPEIYTLKAAVLREMDAAAEASTIFATNTSSLPLVDLRGELSPSRRFLAVHFFNPAEIVPGVEVAELPGSDPATALDVMALLHRLGKTPVMVKAVPGFVANRLQLALFREALLCVEEGIASATDVDEIVRSTIGFRLPHYGPLRVGDMAGLHVFGAILDTLVQTYGDRFEQPELLQTLLAHGDLGLSTGSGIFDYSELDAGAFAAQRDRLYREALGGR